VVQYAKPVQRDDDDGQCKIARPVAHRIIFSQWNEPATDAFHSKMGEPRTHFCNGAIERAEIDIPVLSPCGEQGRGGFTKMDGINFVQGKHAAGGFPDQSGIFTITAGDWF